MLEELDLDTFQSNTPTIQSFGMRKRNEHLYFDARRVRFRYFSVR